MSTRLHRFDRPVVLVWGMKDRAFTPELGQRLRDSFCDARFVEVSSAKTLVPLDAPGILADEISLASKSPNVT